MDFKNFQDPAEVPPSPKAFVQYEENRRKETDQRDAVQKKTFTKWVNKHLLKAGRRIVDLFEGFKDGHNLLSLLEVLSHETLPRERGRMKFHQIQNVQIALEFLRRKGIRLVNIRSDEIVDGNPKLTLGLVWTIILHFQISDVVVPGQPEDITAKEALLLWSRRTTDGYPGVRVQDFTHSWRDGKAFLSVLHRNRPDCIDFRRVQTQTNRQNLELAFSTAEREFGVTRLLDPEDVDVPNPDEKSIITYVASLYDKFPDVPSVEQSLIDNERQLKLEEYGDLTVPLVAWLQDSAVMLSQRDFPTTLVEMKSLMSDLNRFKMEDVPPRLEMRKKLLKLFDEIQSSGTSHMPVSDEVLPDNVNRMWHRFEHALQEREMAIQSEIIRLDRLQRLAEKVHREARQSEEVLSDLERRVQEEERRVDTVHPFESKRSCEAIERALKNQEDMVRSMLRDAQALQDGRYAQAETIYRRVSALQTQVSHLKTEFYNKVLQKAISKSYVKEDITSTRRREVVTEVRLIESNPAFRHIQNCLNWIEEKQKVFEGLEFGSDLASIQANCEQQQHEHAEVLAFKKEIEKCIHARRNLSPEEQDLYTEWLSKVEVAYSLLNTASSRRLKSLESLLDFLQSATQELIWLNEKEEVEVTRDWSSSRLNVPSVDEFYKNLLQEMKTRESQFNSVQDRGNSMVLDRHPASKTIEAYMGEMQSQWSWLLQLSVCLEAHVRHTSAYYQFFEEASECEQWMSRQADSINIRYTDESQSVDTLQMLLKELQELSDHVADYERRVSSLAQHSREIIPLKLRGQPVFSEMRCRCLCIYKQPPMMLSKNEEVFLLDNSQKIRWRVRTLSGQEDLVPSVCILIPPPNYEAIEFADRLKIQLDHLQSLLKMRRRKLRHSMVLGTISLIQGWDPAQFQALDPARREALLRALNEDATKLIAEVGEGDREMRQLKDKLNECNQHFLSLTAAVNEQELRRSRGPDKEFLQKLDSVSYQLSSLDQDLQVRVQQPLPHDNPSLDTARRQQTDWERALQNQEGPVEQVRQAYNTLGTSSPQTDAKISFIDEKWEQLITQGNAHAERLRLLESTLTKLDSLRRFIADQEVALGSQEGMSSDPNALKAQQSDLQTIKTTLEKKQGQLDALMTDIKLLREVVEKGRPDTSRHHDLEDLEKRVEALTGRWTSVGEQVDDRLKSMNVAVETLDNYTNGYATEHQFVAQTQDKIDAQPNLNSDLNMAKQQLSPAMAIYNSLGEHQHQIEAVNRHGGQFIREAKIYEKKLQHYHDNLHQMESRLAEGLHKRPRKTSGAESVKNDLDALNRHYIDQVLWANNRLKDIKTVFSDNNIEIQLPMLVTDRVPLLRTFRAELTKRSSMLVDEDMQEYFQQLSEFEGYGGLQAMGKTGETFGSQTAINVTAMTRSSDSMAFSSAASTPQSPVVKWRMKTPPIPSHRLSNKVASITSLSGISTGSEDMMADLDGSEEANQTLITVRQGCLAAKGTQLNMSAILNPITGRKVTLVDAINSGVLDVKTATIMDARTNKRMSLSQAVTNRYISHDMNKQLNAPCGITDPISGSEFTLIEAIQKELFDPQNNAVKDPSTGKFIPLEEAVTRKLISDYDAQNILGEGVTVTFITQSQPLFTDKDLASTTMRMGLGDVIEDSLYIPKSGKIMDPFTGKELTVLEAVEIGFINPAKREIKDVKSGKMLTLLEAVTSGVIDPEAGRYINKTNGQKLTLDDAYQRKLINKPLMLPRALNENLVLDNGKVIDPQTGRIIPFKEALDTGVIDSDSKCIVDSSTGDVVSVVEAIRNGLLDKQGFVHPDRSSEKESLLDSVDKGQIKFVQEDLTFSKQCVMDTKSGKLLTVQQAIKQGVITSNGDFIDTSSGRRVLLKAASGQGFIDKSVVDSLLKDRSMTDSSGRNISLLKAIQIGLISPDTLKIHDPKSRKAMSLQQATTAGIISTEDAKIVMQVLCPSIAHTTVTTRLQPGAQEVGIRSISVSDAIARGLLNEANGTFRNPNTGAVMPVQTAIEQGMLRLSSEWPVSLDVADGAPKSPRLDVEKLMRQLSEDPTKTAELQKTGKTTVESKVMRKEGDKNYSFTQTVVTKPQISETIVSETKHFKIKSVVDPRTKLEIGVYEATHRGLLDMNKGLFVHPITDEKMSIEAALSRGFVRGVETSEQGPGTSTIKERKSFSLTGVIHPRTGERLPVSQAEKEGILDLQKGMYYGFDTKGQPLHLKISEAIERGFIVAEDGSRDAGPTGGLVHETKTYQLKSVINPLTKQKLDVAEAIKQGIIDEHKGLYINPRTGEKITIPDAIERKLIDAEIMSVVSNAEGGGSKIITTKMTTLMVKFVVDPRTGETITVSKALDEGILDSNMENYKNPLTGEVMTLNEAIDKKLVIAQAAVLDGSKSSSTESIHINPDEEVTESNLVEEVSSETVTFSINSVVDPRTMEMMSYDEAVLYGVLDIPRGLYVNPMTRETTPINIALEKGLIHGEVTAKSKSEDLIHSSVEASHLSFPVRQITSVIDPSDGKEISLDKAVKDKIIDIEKGTYFDVNTLECIPLEKAFDKGYIKLSKTTDAEEIERLKTESLRRESERERRHLSSENGIESHVDMKMEKFNVAVEDNKSPFAEEVFNYTTDVENKAHEPLTVHQQQGVRTWKQKEMAVVDTRSESPSDSEDEDENLEFNNGLSFLSSMKLGLIDAKTGKLRDPETGRFITINEAIDREILDQNKPAMKDILTGKTLTLKQCIDKGIIDPRSGKINEKKAKGEKVEVCPIIDAKQTKGKPLNLLDCVASGLYDHDTGMFTDPKTQNSYTLQEAVDLNLIDGNLVSVMDKQTGEKVTLADALRQGLIDGVTAEIVGPDSGDNTSLLQSVQQGLVENLFDKQAGTLFDTLTGNTVTLDKALTEGNIRSDEAKVLDTSTNEVVPLDVAFRKGLVDVNTGAVTDKITGKKLTPQEAIKMGLLAIVGAPVLATKAVYDAISDKVDKAEKATTQTYQRSPFDNKPYSSSQIEKTSPFEKSVPSPFDKPSSSPLEVKPSSPSWKPSGSPRATEARPHHVNGTSINGSSSLSATENYQEQIIEPRTTIVFAKPGDRIRPSPPTQLFPETNGHSGSPTDEYRSFERYTGLADSYDKLLQDLHNENNWVSDIEQLLKDDQPVSEEAYKAQAQTEALKALHEDVLRHQQPIRSLVYQSEQLVEHHQEELTPEQVTELQNLESIIKVAFGKIQKTCESRMKHLTAATEELGKFEGELQKFVKWLETTDKELERQMDVVHDYDSIRRVTEQHKEMMSDIVAHGADLRLLSFAVSKYMEEAKCHKLELDAYKADRVKPSRLSRTSWIAMDNKEVELVREKQKDAENQYKELKNQCSNFGEKLNQLANKQKEFNDTTWTMLSWLTDAEEKLSMIRQEASAPEPAALREHLEKMRALGNDAIAHKNQLADLEKSGREVSGQMRELDIGGEQVEKIQEIINDISGRHKIVCEEINERANDLQTAVTKSQNVQDAMDQLLGWLKDTDRKLDQQKPVSLNQDKLSEQAKQLSIIETDIDSHKPSIESVKQSANELIKTCDIDMAKTLEGKIADIGSKFLDAQKKCRATSMNVSEVSDKLDKFNEQSEALKGWIQTNTDTLSSSDWNRRPIDQLKEKVDDVTMEKERQLSAMEGVQSLGRELIEDPRTGDTAMVKMSLGNLDDSWSKFDECLSERNAETSIKESREQEYDAIKQEVVQWLTRMEGDVDGFEPVAVDMDVVAKQIEELQPMIQEYYEFSPKIDELNEVGTAYDAIQSGDSRPKSPMRFRSRRHPSSILSPRLRSPSPTMGNFSFGAPPGDSITSPMSMSSDSSGVGSRKSSSDFLQVDDLSETQQDILDMTQRYEMLEERLLDRQHELQGMLGSVKSFLQDLADILSWLDIKEKDLGDAVAIATSEKEAKRRLKEHEHAHAELLSKESLVDEIRRKGQDLMKRKRGVPGTELVQEQLSELDDKWLGVKVSSEQQRKLLEDIVTDLRTYKDAGVHLQKWIAQKEKMVAVLGPVATDPSMVKNQLEQVKVLQEEMKGQEPLYDKFIHSGNAVHDKCTPDSKDASHISEKMTVISKSWERLSDKLREREKSLSSVEGLSLEFSDTLQGLSNWMSDYMTTIDNLSPVATSPEKNLEHQREIKELERELKQKVPILEKAKDLAKKLADTTKDANTKFELKNKISGLEKPMTEAERKLTARSNEVLKASEEGDRFKAGCHELLDRVKELKRKQAEATPVSGDPSILRQQAQQNKDLLKDLNDLLPEIKAAEEKAKQFGPGSSSTTRALLDIIDTVQAEYQTLQQAAAKREEQLETSTIHNQNFQAELDKMLLWLQLYEEKLDGLSPSSIDQDAVGKKLKEAQGLRGDVLKFSYDQELLNREGQALMQAVDSDKGTIKVRLADINQRWDNLNEGLGERIQSLEDISGKLTEVEDCSTDLDNSLKKLEEKLDAHNKLGSSAKDPKHQDKIRTLQDDTSALDTQLSYMDSLLKSLDECDGALPAQKQVEVQRARDRQASLQAQLADLLQDMEAGTQFVDQFQGTVKNAGAKVTELEAELLNMAPVARDESSLKGQERQIEEFISRLNDLDNFIEELNDQYKTLKTDGYVTTADGLAAQLDMLQGQQERLREDSDNRKKDITETANRLEAVTDNLRRMRTSIDRAGDELEMHEPIGSDVNAIKRLQDELKRMKQFQHGVLENLARRVQAVTSDAQSLIQTAASGVDTSGLETDQESLMDKWNSLNSKVSERDRNLDNAILQSGKFNDALRNLLEWLSETEDLVANQKSPSPDYKVAKAQLQEQKFLLKMLDDRAPSVKSVQDSGMSLQNNLEDRERKAIQNQVGQLDQRWSELNTRAQDRANTLENIIMVAQQFQETREPLIGWLDQVEKKFTSLEPTALDAGGIENIIVALKDMEKDLKSKDEDIKKLASTGKQLQNQCKGEDVKNVQRKIDDVQSRFGELSDKITDTQEQMEEALPLAKSFNDSHAKFVDWIVKMEPKTRHKEGNETEDQVQELLDNVKDVEPVLAAMKTDGNQLSELVPGDAGFKVLDTLSKDMKRFEVVNEAIQNKADKFRASKLKSAEMMFALDDLLEWFKDEESLITNCDHISCDPAKLQKQLADQKAMNDDINAEKAKARDIIAMGKRLAREGSIENEQELFGRLEQLKQSTDKVTKMASDHLVQLEQALPLSRTFLDAHQDLLAWFEEVTPAIAELEVMSINQDTVKKQQDKVKVLKQDLQDNKPLIDKLNKAGLALTKLDMTPVDQDQVKRTMDEDNKLIDDIRRAVRDRSMSIDEALQQSAEFTDKLENMLETLTTTEEMVSNATPVAAHPDKLREQIADNNALMEEMQMRLTALESVQTAAEDLIKQASDSQDDAVKDVKLKLRDLVDLYEKIGDGLTDRGNQLEETLEVSDKFWDDLHGLTRTLKDLSDTLSNQEPPALEPALIREQQDTLESIRDDIEASQFDLDEVHQTGEHLLTLCGEPDKPEVQKNIDDLDTSLLQITGDFDKRFRSLEEALEKSTHFQDQLMKTLVWLQKREDRLKELGPVSADFDKVKSQWNEIKLFKSDVDPKHADIEALNQKADELVKGSSPDQEMVVRDPITQVNKRWDGLQESISDRQRMLQLAMLNAGQFDHAMNELLTWLDKTDQMLDEATPVYGDRKLVEIELAKHKVLQNDIIAHDQSVRKVKEAGQLAVTEEGGIRSSTTRRKMDELTELWHKVQDKSASKQKKLEAALSEAKTFNGDMEKMLTKLGQIEGMLITSLPVGGMPETAREQLERFMEVHKELQDLEPTISKLQGAGQQLMQKSNDPAASNIKQNLQVLQQTWEHCKTRAGERKGKLEQAVNQANNFHADLNHFIGWLTDTEKILNNMKPVSRVITHVTEQIKDHTALQKDIKVQRDTMIKLDKLGTHLKYFSQKQDVVLIKNLLASVQQRWEKIVSRSAERTRFLERGFKEAKQFNDMLNDLLTWLADSDQLLTTEFTVGNDPIKIKAQIAKHKEFQKILGSKQPVYDNVNRAGRTLKERSPEEDVPIIQEMLHELKNKWNAVCGKSVDRQRKLEEALLFSGQFNDALDALLDWLAKVEPGLGEDQMVHGDIDTVNNLVEEHKAFQQELGARSNNVAFVRKRARELMDKSEEDTSQQQAQMIELSSMWDRVCKLSVNKQDRLEQAHKLADDFHKKAHDLITWLAQGERQLRYKGPLPDDEGEIIKQIEEHKHFEEEFLRQEANLRETLNIGQDIMKRCHPDAVSTLKHWLSVLKARWEEVSNWSRQRGSRLRDGLATLRRNNQLLEELIAWLNGAETRLYNDNAEPIPEDVDCIQTLIKEHMDFQNEMSGKQPEIDQVTKGDRRRGMSMSGEPVSNIPILKSLSGRRTPTPSKYGSLRRGGRDDDGRRTPEPHFKNPRVGALHNKWRQVWLVSMDRQRRLQDALDYMQEFERMKDFKFDDWRKRYLTWMHHNKSRIMDFFRRQDRDRDGKVTRTEFIQGIMNSKFNTSPMEMEAVANIFDRDGDGYIDYKEFVSALRPNRDPEPVNESELIQDEVKRQVHKCTCVKQYRIHKIGEGKYRFGDSQKLRLVRILRSTVMVRVGGGWMALDEFLVKNDPCRVGVWRKMRFRFKYRTSLLPQAQPPPPPPPPPPPQYEAETETEISKGKTNVELREQFTLASGVSQSMAGFVSKSPSGSSYSGSSTYSGATSPWSARSPSTTSGPVIRVREKAAYSTPWRQNMARYHPDGEVNQIMSTPRRVGRDSPRHFQSPATPVSRSSSRASTGSRPFSPTGSETSEISEPEVFTTVQSETRNIGGRNETTRTYQTHVVTNRTVNTPSRQTTATPTRQSASTPTRLSTSTPTRMSKIPKLTPKKR